MLVYTASMIKCTRSKDEYRRIFKAWDAKVGAIGYLAAQVLSLAKKLARAGGGPLSAFSLEICTILGDF